MPDSPRLALIADQGTDDQAAALLACAARDGWDARLIWTGSGGTLPDRMPTRPTGPHQAWPVLQSLGRRPGASARALRPGAGPPHRSLRALAVGFAPHVMHFLSSEIAQGWMCLAKRLQARTVVSVASDEVVAALDRPRLHERVWAAADWLLIESDALAAVVREQVAVPERVAVVAPAAVEAQPGRAPAPRGWREPLRLLGVGALSWTQGYEHVIEAVALLRDRGVYCRYRIVGRGPHEDAVEFARRQLGMSELVELVKPDGAAALAQLEWADALVGGGILPIAPQAVLGAHLVGIPVIRARTSDDPAAKRSALLVEPLDPVALANAVVSLHRDEALRSRLLSAGRQCALRAPTPAQRSQRLHDFHCVLLGLR